MKTLHTTARPVFMSVLSVLFVHMFGLPSLERFLQQEVTVQVSQQDTRAGNILPTITICAVDPDTSTGWKNGTVDAKLGYQDFLTRECNASTASAVYQCIASRTYSRDQVVLDTVIKRAGKMDDSTKLDWRTDLTTPHIGNCFTLIHPHPMGNDLLVNVAEFRLKETFKYNIIIHDHDYFLLNYNPLTFSKELITIEGNSLSIQTQSQLGEWTPDLVTSIHASMPSHVHACMHVFAFRYVCVHVSILVCLCVSETN